MLPYIFEEKKGIHIIDLNKTIVHLDQASAAMKQIAKSGKKILFVATKKQAKDIVAENNERLSLLLVGSEGDIIFWRNNNLGGRCCLSSFFACGLVPRFVFASSRDSCEYSWGSRWLSL